MCIFILALIEIEEVIFAGSCVGWGLVLRGAAEEQSTTENICIPGCSLSLKDMLFLLL